MKTARDFVQASSEPLKKCQASIRDGECVNKLCPIRGAGGLRESGDGCPLPWDRDEEEA